MDYNVNLDSKTLEACLKEINNIGHTVYQNICTGQSSSVPWGVGDWLGNLFIGALLVMFVTLLVGAVVFVIKEP